MTTEPKYQKMHGPFHLDLILLVTNGLVNGTITVRLPVGMFPTEGNIREAITVAEGLAVPHNARPMTKAEVLKAEMKERLGSTETFAPPENPEWDKADEDGAALTPDRLTWTSKKPSQAGYYWYRDESAERIVTVLAPLPEFPSTYLAYWSALGMGAKSADVEFMPGEWYGPLPSPDAAAGRQYQIEAFGSETMDNRIRKAVESDFQQWMTQALTPDRGYMTPIDNVRTLIGELVTPNDLGVPPLGRSGTQKPE